MFNLNRQTGYALMILDYLERQAGYIALSVLTKKLNLPPQFAAKTAGRLAKAGILESKEGKNGGYRLAQKANKIKLLTVLELFEGELRLVNCQKQSYPCPWHTHCAHKNFFTGKFTNLIIKEIGKWRLSDVFAANTAEFKPL